ncbi:MAG TPA: nicotinate phosphoribosyltransferase [Solirubrobacterales bacterium]|nr:nicotinate phosphoribosyltransferase [Solirubrobacterales bacterium]
MAPPDPNDPGLLSPAQTSLLIDQYELAMAASYHRRGMNQTAIFELFVRHLPPQRKWLLAAGIGPALALVEAMRFGAPELEYLEGLGFERPFLDALAELRFTGDVDAVPEGTVVFANEPLLRVTAPRIEGQLLETLLLNQVNFQTAIATKAARLVLAIGAGTPDRDGRLIDFSPRRAHGVDAAVKAARAAAIAGAGGTSNVAAAMRYGLAPVGTMAHSYVMSFEHERDAFVAFMQDMPHNTVMLVDTYDTLAGVRHAIEAARSAGVPLHGVRIDSGDLLELSRGARRLLDEAGLPDARITASGDLEERRIEELVSSGAPIDRWGVGTDLGTSRDAPAVGGVYKLVADRAAGGVWRGTLKASPDKATIPGAKQVFRRWSGTQMCGDVIAAADEDVEGTPLLVPVMRGGRRVFREELAAMRARALSELEALPAGLRKLGGEAERPDSYPVDRSPALRSLANPPKVDG